MKEVDVKYLSGLLDADGSFFFNYTRGRVYLTIALDLTTGIDRGMKYTDWLCGELGVRPYITRRKLNAVGVSSIKITVSKRTTLEMLVPRLLKYLVIKGKHLDRLFSKYKSLRGSILTPCEIDKLREFVKTSRKDVGPLKVKSWLPKAYVAGFLDGDGCYSMKVSSGVYRVTSVSHVDDRVVCDLLFKQYGGKVYFQDNCIKWNHALGRSNKSFAVPFLRDMHKHSRLKKWKIEQLLNRHSQRLTDKNPAG